MHIASEIIIILIISFVLYKITDIYDNNKQPTNFEDVEYPKPENSKKN